jgi:hypothetical protein
MRPTPLATLVAAIVLCTAGLAEAATVTRTVGSFTALRLATTGKPHTCIATALDNSTASVYCELGSRARRVHQEYRAPLVWIKTHYAQGETSGIWISGGYDATGKPLSDAAPSAQGAKP